MPTVITVEQESATHSSSRSNSYTDEGSSTGTGVHVSRTSGSQEDSDLLDDQGWDPVYSDEIEPSESASRPRPSHYRRSGSRQPAVRRGPIRRHTTTERTSRRPPLSRVHRQAVPNPPSSVDPQDDYPGYGRGILPPGGPYGGRVPQPGYAQSFVSFSPPPLGGHSGQMMPYGGPGAYPYPQNPFAPAQGVGGQGYYPSHQTPGHGIPGYGGHEVMAYGQGTSYGYGGYGLPPQGPQSQYYPHLYQQPPSPPEVPAAAPSAVSATAAAAAAEKSEVEKKMAALEKLLEDAKVEAEKTKQEADRLKREAEEKRMAAIVETEKAKREAEEKKMLGIIEAERAKREAEEKKIAALQRLLEDTKHEAEVAKKTVADRAAADKKAAEEAQEKKMAALVEAERAKREAEEKKMAALIEAEKSKREAEEKKLAALERLLEDTKHDAAAAKKVVAERDAADKKAADEAALNAATDKKVKEEVAKVKAEADKKTKAAEEAKAKAEEEKKAADEAKAKAEAEAKALANPPKKPLKFKDAVGRKFSFPFDLCRTWAGMEDLIRQAFLHVEVIGPHVAEGHYDLVGPNGEIILPQVWETMIEPDWAITMHMWPLPEQPKGPPEGVHIVDVGPGRPVSGPRRRERADRPIPPPPGGPGRRGPPPPPPPGWIGPQPRSRMGGHDLGGAEPEIVVIEDNAPRVSKKKVKDTGGVLSGLLGGKPKQSGKGPKKAELYDACRVM